MTFQRVGPLLPCNPRMFPVIPNSVVSLFQAKSTLSYLRIVVTENSIWWKPIRVKKCSGPTAYPLIGNLNMFVGDAKDITNNLMKLNANYSSPLLLWIGPKLVVVLYDPENIEIISKSSNGYEKSSFYKFINVFLGNGLFTSPGKLYVHMLSS
ncbi:hypothetical protein M0804_015413 [Polistes exclamans]|nr:hypothetical protein M0804_015413 [Polistes exclamans]